MSYGFVICSVCHREVHQDGPDQTWTHCADKSRICHMARAIYPESKDDIKGKWCGKDAGPDAHLELFEAKAPPFDKPYTPPVDYVGRVVPRFGPMGPAPFLQIPGEPRRRMRLNIDRAKPEAYKKRDGAFTPPKLRNKRKSW